MFGFSSIVSRLLILSAACCGSCGLTATAWSQDVTMRPVPRFSGTSVRDQRSEMQKSAAAANLQWRLSGEVAPPAKAAPSPAPLAATASPTATSPSTASPSTASPSTASIPANGASGFVSQTSGTRQAIAPVLQAKYQNAPSPPDNNGLTLPPGLQSPSPPSPPAPDSARPLPDFFADPFGENLPSGDDSPSLQMPVPEPPPASNELRSPAPLGEPLAPPAGEPAAPAELPPPAAESPSLTPPNPFDRTRSGQERDADDRDRRELEDFDIPLRPSDRPTAPAPRQREFDDGLKRPMDFSCDDFRKSISEDNIQKVSLDISPPFRPDVIELDEFQKLKTKFNEAQQVRDWQSVDGRKLGRGRLRDLAYEKVIIETEHGTIEELSLNRVSEADLAYLSKNWGLPQECLIDQVAYEPRSWQHSKVTWKASNLCHKPLYFEEVNLERYGHTAGPFAQPIISSAHFFANIAVLPYKMGVHPPSECQYTLGYYRPGNCAPWIVPPVPISLRGGLYQAAAMTGAFWLIP